MTTAFRPLDQQKTGGTLSRIGAESNEGAGSTVWFSAVFR